MSYLFITIIGLTLAGLTMLIRAALLAPEGYEDATGFHQLEGDPLVRHAAPGQSLFAAEGTFSYR